MVIIKHKDYIITQDKTTYEVTFRKADEIIFQATPNKLKTEEELISDFEFFAAAAKIRKSE